MQLGIFAKTFNRPTFEESLDEVVEHGLKRVQFNLATAGLPTLPETMNPDRCALISRAFQDRELVLDAISGTFNMIQGRASGEAVAGSENLRRLELLASACRWV